MNSDKRLYVIFVATLMFSLGLLGRLLYLQILTGPQYAKRADAQRTSQYLEEVRGDIFDRNGASLTDSHFDLYATISPMWLMPAEKQLLMECNLLTEEDGEGLIEINVSQENQWLVERLRGETPSIFTYEKKVRYGPGAVATHVVGYRGETGIEKSFDEVLKSGVNVNTIVRDGLGQPIAGLSEGKGMPVSWGVKLTIDKDIQTTVEEIMDKKVPKGAIVVLDAKTGEVLAMASRPDYKQYAMKDYLDREDAPLINRAVEGFSPGSIFKIIVMAAALEEKISFLDEIFHCPGFIKIGGNEFKCASFKNGGHGDMTLKDAMVRSCNSVFIELGLRLDKEKIIKYARLLGLGKKTSLGLREEKSGFIPEQRDVYYEDIGNLAIGQGPIEVTPLQAAQLMLTVVNGGIEKKPFIVKEIVDSQGNTTTPTLQEGQNRVLSLETSKNIMVALKNAVKYGTGIRALPSLELGESAGKTGTAEITDDIYHAWFLGYYPAETPDYVISVFIERGGSGAVYAAPVFKEIIENINSIE